MSDHEITAELERWDKVEREIRAGHALRDKGKPFTIAGETALRDPGRVGACLCECGATSRKLYSDVSRRRWHREHLESLGIGHRAVAQAFLGRREEGGKA